MEVERPRKRKKASTAAANAVKFSAALHSTEATQLEQALALLQQDVKIMGERSAFRLLSHEEREERARRCTLFQYLESTPNCHDLFACLERLHKNRSARSFAVALDMLTHVLRYNWYPATKHLTHVIGKHALTSQMGVVQSLMAGKTNYRQIAAGLRLLGAVALSSPYNCGEILTLLHLGTVLAICKTKQKAKKRENPEHDVRTHYLRFVVALLRAGDTQTRTHLLSTHRPLLLGAINSLHEDAPYLVRMVVKALHRYVMCDSKIARGVKSQFFAAAMGGLAAVMRSFKGNAMVEKVMSAVLIELCTSDRSGIMYREDAWFVAEQDGAQQSSSRNTHLLTLLRALRPHESPAQQHVLRVVLRALPLLLSPYLAVAHHLFQVRPSFQWLHAAAWLQGVLAELPPVRPASIVLEENSPKMEARLLSLAVPGVLGEAHFWASGLQQDNDLVVLQLLLLLNATLQRALLVLRGIRGECRALRQHLRSQLPTVEVLLSVGARASAMRADSQKGKQALIASLLLRVLSRYRNDLNVFVWSQKVDEGLMSLGSIEDPWVRFPLLEYMKGLHDMEWWRAKPPRFLRLANLLLQEHSRAKAVEVSLGTLRATQLFEGAEHCLAILVPHLGDASVNALVARCVDNCLKDPAARIDALTQLRNQHDADGAGLPLSILWVELALVCPEELLAPFLSSLFRLCAHWSVQSVPLLLAVLKQAPRKESPAIVALSRYLAFLHSGGRRRSAALSEVDASLLFGERASRLAAVDRALLLGVTAAVAWREALQEVVAVTEGAPADEVPLLMRQLMAVAQLMPRGGAWRLLVAALLRCMTRDSQCAALLLENEAVRAALLESDSAEAIYCLAEAVQVRGISKAQRLVLALDVLQRVSAANVLLLRALQVEQLMAVSARAMRVREALSSAVLRVCGDGEWSLLRQLLHSCFPVLLEVPQHAQRFWVGGSCPKMASHATLSRSATQRLLQHRAECRELVDSWTYVVLLNGAISWAWKDCVDVVVSAYGAPTNAVTSAVRFLIPQCFPFAREAAQAFPEKEFSASDAWLVPAFTWEAAASFGSSASAAKRKAMSRSIVRLRAENVLPACWAAAFFRHVPYASKRLPVEAWALGCLKRSQQSVNEKLGWIVSLLQRCGDDSEAWARAWRAAEETMRAAAESEEEAPVTAATLKQLLEIALEAAPEQAGVGVLARFVARGGADFGWIERSFRAMLASSLWEDLISSEAPSAGSSGEAFATQLVQLLQALLMQRPQMCSEAVLGRILPVYRATTSVLDLALFRLIRFCEQRGYSLESVGYIWGQRSAEEARVGVEAARDALYNGQHLPEERLILSALHFPVRRVAAEEQQEEKDALQKGESAGRVVTFDPCFLLPFFRFVLGKYQQNCRKFAESGALAFTIMGCCARAEEVRRHAYDVLQLFSEQVAQVRFRWQPQLHWLLHTLRASVQEKYQCLPSIVGVFLAKFSLILCRPEHFLYATVNEWMLRRSTFDLADLPLAYELLFAENEQQQRGRQWFWQSVAQGCKRNLDWKVVHRRHIVDLALSWLVTLSPRKEHPRILQMLAAIVSDAKLGRVVERKCGMSAWILSLGDQQLREGSHLLASITTSLCRSASGRPEQEQVAPRCWDIGWRLLRLASGEAQSREACRVLLGASGSLGSERASCVAKLRLLKKRRVPSATVLGVVANAASASLLSECGEQWSAWLLGKVADVVRGAEASIAQQGTATGRVLAMLVNQREEGELSALWKSEAVFEMLNRVARICLLRVGSADEAKAPQLGSLLYAFGTLTVLLARFCPQGVMEDSVQHKMRDDLLPTLPKKGSSWHALLVFAVCLLNREAAPWNAFLELSI